MSEEEALSAEEEAPSADAEASVRAWWSCENYFESEECGCDPRALFSMTVGNSETSGKHLFLRVTEEPFISHRCCAKELKPNAKMLRLEIIHRSKAYVYVVCFSSSLAGSCFRSFGWESLMRNVFRT